MQHHSFSLFNPRLPPSPASKDFNNAFGATHKTSDSFLYILQR